MDTALNIIVILFLILAACWPGWVRPDELADWVVHDVRKILRSHW